MNIDLWVDWCLVTRTPSTQRDPVTLARFARQACASQALVRSLAAEPRARGDAAPAWPAAHRDDPDALPRLLRHVWRRVAHPDTDWVTRLRLRRLGFTAVLIAPVQHGGLGLDRARALGLSPAQLDDRRANLGSTPDEEGCGACAVWSWLEVLTTSNGWSHHSVKALAHERPELGAQHRHVQPVQGREWLMCLGMLPAIDQWGYLNTYGPMHPSSLSILIRTMAHLIGQTLPEVPVASSVDQRTRPPARTVTADEEAAIFARADELNARLARILQEYG